MQIYIVSDAYELTGDSENPKAFMTKEKALAYLMGQARQYMEDIHDMDEWEGSDERTDEEIFEAIKADERYYYLAGDEIGCRWISEVELEG